MAKKLTRTFAKKLPRKEVQCGDFSNFSSFFSVFPLKNYVHRHFKASVTVLLLKRITLLTKKCNKVNCL